MLYQSYKQKLSKLLNVFLRVFRLRFVILPALVALIVLIVVLLNLTGNVYGESFPETVVYGSEFSLEAKAIFRSVSYEFCEAGTQDWTDGAPQRTGEYQVRAVAKSVGGKNKYGKTFTFRIVPLETELVIKDQVVYGEEPEVTADLVGSDCLSDVKIESVQTSEQSFFVNVLSVRVRNGDGTDVSDCYVFTKTQGEARVIPREITVSTDGATKQYDGTPLQSDSYRIVSGTLVQGDEMTLAFPQLTSAGEMPNQPDCSVQNRQGKEVTGNYSISYDCGTLEVTPRPVTVRTGSKTWIYDGLAHSYADWYETEGLLTGHTAEMLPESVVKLKEVTDTDTEVKSVENSLRFVIRDADGNDVTQNYSFIGEYGRLRIKTEIIITVYPIQKVYDGTPLSFEREDYSVIKPPDVEVTLTLPSLTEVGICRLKEISVSRVGVTDKESGRDVVAENRIRFNGDKTSVILEVSKRRIQVTSKSIARVWGDESILGWIDEDYAWISLGSLVDGHTIEIAVTGKLSPHENGPKSNTIDYQNTRIYDADGNDVTRFYEITLCPGVLQWIYGK